MSEEPTPQSDVVKAINDRLAELEDLQLVNKLDIINVKNELDKASLSGGPSSDDMDKVGELRELVEKSDKLKKAEKLADDLEAMRDQLEGAKRADTGKLKNQIEDITAEMAKIRERMSAMDKAPAQKGGKVPSGELSEIKERISKLETAKPGEIDLEVPEEIREEISRINEKIAGLEKPASGAPAAPKEILDKIGVIDEISSRIEQMSSSLQDQGTRLSGLETSMTKAPAKGGKGAAATDLLVSRIDLLEKKITEISKAKPAPAKAQKAPQAPADDSKLDELSKDLMMIKQRVDTIEASKPSGVSKADIEKLKASVPSADMSAVRGRMDKLETDLSKLAKLAMALKPIELPATEARAGVPKELQAKIKELESAIGSGVGEERFRTLEKRMDEMRQWLPEYIETNVKKKLEDLSRGVSEKVVEVERLKEEMVSSTIEQLLAQPATVNKMLGEKLQKRIDDMEGKVKEMGTFVKPSDAKLTSLLKEIEDMRKDMDELRKVMKATRSVSGEELEDMGIELKALNTRIISLESSTRGIETSGVSGVMRDLEILKTKADWLESTIHKLDLDKIHAKIDELENTSRMNSQSSGMAPIIIE